MTERDILERVYKIEVELRHRAEEDKRREELQRQTAQSVDAVDEKLTKVLLELERNKGFIGGILFVATAVWVFVKTALPYTLKLFGKE